ncbi:MAG: FeS-binding protein [Desulfovibrionaceae bacterium]
MTSRTPARLYAVLVFVLALTGFAQMPIFKRYYIADIPGLGWLAQYYVTHKIHYVGAALLLALVAWAATGWLARWSRSRRMTGSGWVRALLLVGIVLTGIIRMYKNQPGVSFSPELTMVVDWAHLGLVLLLGLAALAARVLGKRDWTVPLARAGS